jgi:K(+)-stimulated pyrophosphate-energized sodium pump
MLTLTGNTISMDVFGPVADNANGIGEMGYDRQAMGETKYKEARQILADLDAVGNTTKAVTKGVAIGSAVSDWFGWPRRRASHSDRTV